MGWSTFDRFDYDRISETPEYKLYSRMSKEWIWENKCLSWS
jgi:hypothetical protein